MLAFFLKNIILLKYNLRLSGLYIGSYNSYNSYDININNSNIGNIT